jgi:hypothetical protein
MNCHRLEKFEESEADALKKALGERCERRKVKKKRKTENTLLHIIF